MGRENSTIDWEIDIYRVGKQMNIWPFSDVVSSFKRELQVWKNDRPPRVLEVGCGAGNNLWALSSMGYESFGIDIAPSAISFAKNRFEELNLTVRMSEASMREIPFEDGFFDFVLDRAAITQVSLDEVPDCVAEIHRVLSDYGKLHSFGLFGENHSGRLLGELQDNGSYDNFSGGIFASVGLTTFFNHDLIEGTFSSFSQLEISRRIVEVSGVVLSEEYSVVARV